MRYVKHIIDQVRKQTENDEVTEFTGIQDSEFLQYLNDAQHSLQALITQQYPEVFIREEIIQAVGGQERYDLPSDCYLGNKVVNVEFSGSGSEDDFYIIEEESLKRRVPGVSSSPLRYIRQDGQILITPQPQSGGKIRVTYVKRIKELDLRRAKITEAPTISSINNWSISIKDTNLDSLSEHEYICIVDKRGNTIAKNLGIESVSSDSINLDPHTSPSDELTIQENHFIVGGKDSTTHGEFDRSVERYMIAYCAWKILKRDSSIDSQEAIQELSLMAKDIVASYGAISDDVRLIPQLNSWDDWSY